MSLLIYLPPSVDYMANNPTICEKFATGNYAPLKYSNSKLVRTNLMLMSFHSKIRGFDCGLLLFTDTVLKPSVSDPDSIRSVDPYPDLESGTGSRRAKKTHRNRKK